MNQNSHQYPTSGSLRFRSSATGNECYSKRYHRLFFGFGKAIYQAKYWVTRASEAFLFLKYNTLILCDKTYFPGKPLWVTNTAGNLFTHRFNSQKCHISLWVHFCSIETWSSINFLYSLPLWLMWISESNILPLTDRHCYVCVVWQYEDFTVDLSVWNSFY